MKLALPLLVVVVVVGAPIGVDAGCAVTKEHGCYHEKSNTERILGAARYTAPMQAMTKAVCAQICKEAKHVLAGVEYGQQCYCGDKTNYPPVTSTACTTKCRGNASETCGGSSAIDVFEFSCSGAPVPIPHPTPSPSPHHAPARRFVYHGCTDAASKALPYCNPALTDEARVDDILKKLSLADKIALGSPTKAPFCACHTTPIASASLPDYKWLTETNSCVNAPCAGQYQCPTTFVGPNNMASSFNRSSWYAKGDVISSDMRALNNQLWAPAPPASAGEGAAAEADRATASTPEPGDTGLTGFGPVNPSPPPALPVLLTPRRSLSAIVMPRQLTERRPILINRTSTWSRTRGTGGTRSSLESALC